MMVEIKRLEDIGSLSREACDFLKGRGADGVEDGRYDFSDGVYINVQTFEAQGRAGKAYEAHRNYIDVQLILQGAETISVASLDELTVEQEYDGQRDIAFYSGSFAGTDFTLEAGQCLILYPEDAHMPGIRVEGRPARVKKAVVKVPVALAGAGARGERG